MSPLKHCSYSHGSDMEWSCARSLTSSSVHICYNVCHGSGKFFFHWNGILHFYCCIVCCHVFFSDLINFDGTPCTNGRQRGVCLPLVSNIHLNRESLGQAELSAGGHCLPTQCCGTDFPFFFKAGPGPTN